MEKMTEDLIGLEKIAEELLNYAQKRRKFAIKGAVGAGKTTLVQQICRLLGVSEPISSPTYSIINEYQADQNLEPVYHMDLYRLEGYEAALDVGIEEYLYSPFYCFIEWPEIIESLLPEDIINVEIKILGNSKRKILFL